MPAKKHPRNIFKNGHLYIIEFRDHSYGVDKTFICTAAGWVIKESEHDVILTPWLVRDSDETVVKQNYEPFGILKCAITKTRMVADGKKK